MNLKPWLTRQAQRYLNSALALSAGIALLLPFSNSLLAQESRFDGLEYRSIGPFRGGRSAAVTGVPGENNLYYMGSTGGGVWETRDGGANWKNISDGYFGGSIGAVAVSEWDPNVIYVGGGEVTVRGNVSHGSGMWKSTDGGKTWSQVFDGGDAYMSLLAVKMVSETEGWMGPSGLLPGSNTVAVTDFYQTTDGGATWSLGQTLQDCVAAEIDSAAGLVMAACMGHFSNATVAVYK